MAWDPGQYLKFADHRGRPFTDLVGRIAVADPRDVVDLGCGPGNVTATLAERWPRARIQGIDSSAEMIAAAGDLAGPSLSFAVADIHTWRPSGPLDVIVTNAALQWVPGHEALLAGWVAALRPGGALAIQVPKMSGSPAGRVIGAVATLPRFQDVLTGVSAPTVAATDNGVVRPTAEYIERLTGLGCRVDAWETVYQHVLPGDGPVLEWFRGTGLRPYLDALDPARRDDFTAEVAEGLRRAYPRQVFGTVLPFRRVFVVAHRPA